MRPFQRQNRDRRKRLKLEQREEELREFDALLQGQLEEDAALAGGAISVTTTEAETEAEATQADSESSDDEADCECSDDERGTAPTGTATKNPSSRGNLEFCKRT